MIHRILITLLVLGLSFSILSAQQPAAMNILFIMDASGSMWAKMDKSTRIAYAKDVMSRLADKIPAGSNVGLIAYGHSKEADCNDIASLIPLKTFDKTDFLTVIKNLQPKGKTPIARSIQFALKEISGIKEAFSIVLVTDGLESCDGDACAQLKKAKAEGRNITMHVIGFGMTEENLSTLECLAQAGGGQYVSAANADELQLALEHSILPPPAGNAFLSVAATLDGKLKDATVKVIRTDVNAPEVSGRTYEHTSTNPRIFNLNAGTYTVEVFPIGISGLGVMRYENLIVTAADTIFKVVEFKQAIVKVRVTRNGELSDASVHIYPVGSSTSIANSRTYNHAAHNPSALKIPPGIYDLVIASVEISGRPVVRFEKWEVASAGLKEFSHDFRSGELLIGAVQGADLVDATVNVVRMETGEVTAAGRTYMSATSNPKKFILSPGKYRVDLGPVKPQGLEKKSIEVEIVAGSQVTRTVNW